MTKCATCGTTIVWGGYTRGTNRFCSEKCLEAGKTLDYCDDIPDEIAALRAVEIRDSPCPICSGPGPIDFYRCQQLISMIVVTQAKDRNVLGCQSCGRRAQLRDTVITLLCGWWKFPMGLILTPIFIGSNLIRLNQPMPEGPSALLLDAAKLDLAANLRQRVERGSDQEPRVEQLSSTVRAAPNS